MKKFFLIVGKSGSGKDTLINSMVEHGFKKVLSYTTRDKRKNEKDTHTFVTESEFFKLRKDMVAYSEFNENMYGATYQQIEQCDILTVDPDGIEYFMEHYRGDKEPVIIYIDTSRVKRWWRMLKRGDGIIGSTKRLINDYYTFSIISSVRMFYGHPVYKIDNNGGIARSISQLYSVLTNLN